MLLVTYNEISLLPGILHVLITLYQIFNFFFPLPRMRKKKKLLKIFTTQLSAVETGNTTWILKYKHYLKSM